MIKHGQSDRLEHAKSSIYAFDDDKTPLNLIMKLQQEKEI